MPKQYEKRDKAFRIWAAEYGITIPEDVPFMVPRSEALKSAFNAGWEARKKAVDYALPDGAKTVE